MQCRKSSLKITAVFLILFVTIQAQTQTNSRSYDTNDWIPVSRPGGQNDEEEPVQKRPSGRVLNLPPRDEKRLYPAEPSETHQPPYRVPLNHQTSKEGRRENHQLHHHQGHRQFPIQPNKYPQPPPPQAEFLPTPQQQILLPPQLQGIINQGPPYLTPQRINAQLLQDYQSSIEALPTQQYPLNATEFNPSNLVQNINLGLYDQQPIGISAHHNKPQHKQHHQQHRQQHPQHHSQQHSQHHSQQQQVYQTSIKPVENDEEQEVQLVYVPLEDLQRQRGQRQQINFQTEQQVVPTIQAQIYHQQQPQQYRPPHQNKQIKLQNLEQEYAQQVLQSQKLQEQLQQHNIQPPSQLQHSYRGQFLQDSITKPATTSAPSPALTPKKRKPHQPPLAVYMGTEGHNEIKIGDVLTLLKDAKSISVQDSVGPDSPQIFVGPSHLEAPDGYAKFELPYLSSIEGNRIERKVDQLPFFVAPLSYKAPPGYSKIPFPAPHVGSVVVNNHKATPTQPTSTEHTRFVSTHNAEDSNSQVFEITTLRSRTRQRLPSRGHSVPTVQTPLPSDIPYGPLPTKVSTEKQESYSAEDTNPYGPTQFVQSTTPSTFEKAIPEQVFATKNRFSTPTATFTNNKNSPVRHQTQYLAVSTEANPSSTLSGGLSNDKYTVLEEFIANKQPQYEDHIKGPTRNQIRFRPTQNTYTDHESGEQTSLPLISNTNTQSSNKYNLPSVHLYKPTLIQKDEQVQYASTPASTKHRIVESYTNIQAEQPITQNSPAYEIASHQTREQEHFVPDYYGTHLEDKAPTRGKQHFTPDKYFQEDDYETENKHYKSTEAQVSSTKEPVIPYKLPEIQTHYVSEVAESYVTPETYKQQAQAPHNQEYVLPAQLPPISPQLPGLINSLQDQALRPLLAPLLIPASEQTPLEASDSSAEYYSSPEPVTTTTAATTTTTTTTSSPYIETTTQFKRIRSRIRGTRPTTPHDYASTTISPRRPTASTAYRGKRPNYNQPRQEYTRTRENYPVSSTIQSEEVPESTTKAIYSRNRHTPRERPYVASTTEQPRRVSSSTVSPTSRQRFRTRGRPTTSEEDFTERSSVEDVPVFKQPVYEGGFQASLPAIQANPHVNIPATQIYYDDNQKEVSIQRDVSAQRAQTEKALVYVQANSKLPDSEAVPVYSARPNYISSTESLEPLFHSTIVASAPDNNILQDQPTILVNPSPTSHLKYSTTEPTINSRVEYNHHEPSHLRYKELSEIKEDPTTEITRSRTRQRVKTRPRVNQVTTSRYSQQPTTPASSRSPAADSEESQEFYGFFRQPNFQKPVQVEYKQEVEIRPVQRVTPTVAYIRRPTQEPQKVYVNPESPIYSTPRTYSQISQVEDNQAYPNIQSQYVSSTLSPSSASAEESDEIQPITRRPAINSRARRPNTPVRSDSAQITDRYYTRTTKRPEAAAPATRTRSRIRKPLRPTSLPNSSGENTYSHSPRTNELENQSSEDYQEVAKSTRTRITNNRGKTHFHNPQVEKNTDAELEEDNYPTIYLHGQNIHQHRPHIGNVAAESTQRSVVSAEAITPQTSFQLTIEPEDSAEDYRDQIPNYSFTKPKVASKDLEDGIEESQVSAKFVEKPQNFNFISAHSKSKEDKLSFKQTTEFEVNKSTLTTTPATPTSENDENVELSTLDPQPATDSSEIITTDFPTTTEEIVTDKARKRGVWKLSKIRPVTEEFESAESQNVGSVLNNEFSTEKTFKKYNFVNRNRPTEPTVFETTTLPFIPETTAAIHENIEESRETTTSTTEGSILDPLFEMFGFSGSEENSNEEIIVPQTTDTSNVYTTIAEVVTTLLPQYNVTTQISDQLTTTEESEDAPVTPRIIGTSTTTEISHETEICYRGKCIKSTSTEIIDQL